MTITTLLKRFFAQFMFGIDGDPTGGGGGSGDSIDELSDMLPDDEPPETEDDAAAAARANESSDTEQQTNDDPNDPDVVVTVDGQDRTVKYSDLVRNAQKYLAGDKRLEEAANLRKQLEPEQQAVKAERMQLQQALGQYTQQLAAWMQQSEPDWNYLLQNDPTEYVRVRHVWDTRRAELQQAQAAQAELTRREQYDQAVAAQARNHEEQEKLLAALPDWKDPAKAKAEASAIDGYLQTAGFNDEERNGLTDHRMVVVARKAMLYDQLQAQQAQATNRVARVPPRSERPGTSQQGQQAHAQRQAAEKRHQANPSVETLADLL